MKKQNTAVRRAALAVLSGRICGGCYVPAGDHQRTGRGDDKLTLNGWLYDMGRMSFLAVCLARDLKEQLEASFY